MRRKKKRIWQIWKTKLDGKRKKSTKLRDKGKSNGGDGEDYSSEATWRRLRFSSSAHTGRRNFLLLPFLPCFCTEREREREVEEETLCALLCPCCSLCTVSSVLRCSRNREKRERERLVFGGEIGNSQNTLFITFE